MRGKQKQQVSLLTLRSPEQMVPKGHPARAIKRLADQALAELEGLFERMYSESGRPSIPPEVLL